MNQHNIPQFILKKMCSNGVWRLLKNKRKIKNKGYKNSASREDQWTNQIETQVMSIDAEAAKILNNNIFNNKNPKKFNSKQKILLAKWMALFLIRRHERNEVIENDLKNLSKLDIIKMAIKENKLNESEIISLITGEKIKIDPKKVYSYVIEMNSTIKPRIKMRLYWALLLLSSKWKWHLLKSKHGFIIGDGIITVTKYRIGNCGIKHANEIFLPISSRYGILLIKKSKYKNFIINCNKKRTINLNDKQYHQAYENIFGEKQILENILRRK